MGRTFSKIRGLIGKRYLNVSYDRGAGYKKTIVFLHGLSSKSDVWQPIICRLEADCFRIICLDLLGFNDSPKRYNYTIDDHVKYIKRTLHKIGVREPFVIVGHSMGAIIAARFSYYYPDDVLSEYLISPPIYLNDSRMQTKVSKMQNDAYMKLYDFLSDNPRFTIKLAQKAQDILKYDAFQIDEDSWDSFNINLNNIIINQDTYNDIARVNIPIKLFYGNLDQFIIKANLKKVSQLEHVETTSIKVCDHRIDDKFASVVASELNKLA